MAEGSYRFLDFKAPDFYFAVFAVFAVSGVDRSNREASSPLKRKFPAKSVSRNTTTPEPAVQ